MPQDVLLSRRERQRAGTVREIRDIAMRQVDEGGLGALSLNAIAKDMGMSGPALYRYFPSRDDLLQAVAEDAYGQLAGAVRGAHAAAARRTPAKRLHAILDAYRAWARLHPRRYALLFRLRDDGVIDSDEAIAAIHAGMMEILQALAAIVDDRASEHRPDELDRQLTAWAETRDGADAFSVTVLRSGVLLWARAHGIVTLELAGAFDAMGIDADDLLLDEVDSTIDALRASP